MTVAVDFVTVDVFTDQLGAGNPAGIVVADASFDPTKMQKIAAAIGYNETVFIFDSQKADFCFRYFTPAQEMPLCGHATIGGVKYLAEQQRLPAVVTIETLHDVLSMTRAADGEITMEQEPPMFENFTGSLEDVARVLGLAQESFHPELPVVYGSTGSWTLLVPLKEAASLAQIKPLNQEFPQVLAQKPRCSIHPFLVTTTNIEEKNFTARHFSSPYSGTVEDPVTGTATGVMAAYLQDQIYQAEMDVSITVFQGKEVGRPGKLTARALRQTDGQRKVTITGEAVIGETQTILDWEE